MVNSDKWIRALAPTDDDQEELIDDFVRQNPNFNFARYMDGHVYRVDVTSEVDELPDITATIHRTLGHDEQMILKDFSISPSARHLIPYNSELYLTREQRNQFILEDNIPGWINKIWTTFLSEKIGRELGEDKRNEYEQELKAAEVINNKEIMSKSPVQWTNRIQQKTGESLLKDFLFINSSLYDKVTIDRASTVKDDGYTIHTNFVSIEGEKGSFSFKSTDYGIELTDDLRSKLALENISQSALNDAWSQYMSYKIEENFSKEDAENYMANYNEQNPKTHENQDEKDYSGLIL